MYSVTKTTTFDAAHMLSDYEGPCGNVHGHTYKVEATLSRPAIKKMLVDFNLLKQVLEKTTAGMDHAFLYDYNSPEEVEIAGLLTDRNKKTYGIGAPTTAEYLAHEVARFLQYEFESCDIKVAVWETPTSRAEVCL